MAVEVYWWPPHGDNIGHAALKVDGGSPSGTEYLSAWPGSGWSIALIGSGGYHLYEEDVAYGGAPVVVRLTKLDETAIKKRIKVLKGHGIYSFSIANCATQAGAALHAGVPLVVPYPIPNAPWAVYYYARSLRLLFA